MFNVFGINIHLYGLILGVGIWIGLMIAISANKRYEKEIDDAFLWALAGGIIGARIYHLIDFWQRYYQYNFWKVFALWEGGLGIWGAIAGVILSLYIYCKIKNKNIWLLMDAFAVGAPIAQAIGRLGNYVNGEIVGKNGEPLFAYEAILNIILFIILKKISGKKHLSGKIFAIYIIGYGVIRILLENIRPDNTIWKVAGIPVAIIFGLVAIIFGIFLNGFRVKPGMTKK